MSLPEEIINVVRLSEVATITDSLHSTPAYSLIGYPMVRVTDVRDFYLETQASLKVSKEIYKEFTKRETPQQGDIIFTRVGSYGNSCLTLQDKNFCLGQNTALIRPHIDPHYLLFCLKSPFIKEQIESSVVGSTQKTISIKSIKDLLIPIHSKEEIASISQILSSLQSKIELNRKTNETLEAMAKALFKSWFVDFDPVRAKVEGRPTGLPAEISDLFPDSFEDSELGDIPGGWEVAEIDQIVNLKKDSIDPSFTPEETFDHYSIPAFDAGKNPAKDLGSSIKSQKFLVDEGDLLVSKLNPSTTRVWIPFSSSARRSICSTEFLVCRASTDVGRAFAYCLASSDSIIEVMTGLAGGTSNSHQRIRPGDFLALDCCIGSQKVRSAFSDVVEPLLGKTLAQRIESRSLASARDALLPKLISGEIRIPDVKQMLEEVGI